ncbi:hypothetical protein FRC17_004252, partial [Serendipita sp. 399]
GPNDLPTWISLECHIDADKQPQLVKIMQEAWGDKLLSTRLEGIDGTKVSPNDLRGRIVMMVEWYPPPGNSAEAISKVTQDDSSSSSESDDDNDDVKEMQQYRQSHKGVRPKMHEGLAKLGIYANSFKPQEGWLDKGRLLKLWRKLITSMNTHLHTELMDPLHALVNISESALLTLLKQAGMEGRLVEHGRHHLRRCYPKGLRVDSENLNPIQYWKCGTHVVGLNMQAWDTGTHINGALFRDTDGYVLKPESLRGGKKRTGKSQLKLTIVGGDDIPHAKEGKSRSLYVVAKVFRGTQKLEWKTKPVKDDDADPMFLSTVEWNWDDDDLVFLRVELKEDVWGRDNEVASYTLLVDRLASGLRFWPLFDKSGMPSVVSRENISLENVAFNVLPSKVQTVATDVMYVLATQAQAQGRRWLIYSSYFTKDSYQGVAVYRRITSDEQSRRGARMISVGVIVENSTRPRPWKHINALKRFAVRLEDNLDERDSLEAYFNEHKVSSTNAPEEEPWDGWEEELSRATMDHPAFHLAHVLHVMGISSLTVFKHALGRRRILIHTHPPVEPACLLAQLAAVISTGEEGSSNVHAQRITVLGIVGLIDLKRIEEVSAQGNGWIACTTDAIFLEKTGLYDLLIDLTSPAQQRPHRPSLSLSRLSEGSSTKMYKLQSVRYTWSDVKLWTELERILEADMESGGPNDLLANRSRWIDPWGLYDDVCIVCAGIWTGWRPSAIQRKLELSTGSHLQPSSGSTPISSSDLTPQLQLSADVKDSNRQSIDPRLGPLPVPPSTRAKVTTLSLLSSFHNHTHFLHSKLTRFLADTEGTNKETDTEGTNKETIMTPKDVVTFDLGPGSELDARFLEWLGETRGQKVKVRRGWKDLFRYIFGFA